MSRQVRKNRSTAHRSLEYLPPRLGVVVALPCPQLHCQGQGLLQEACCCLLLLLLVVLQEHQGVVAQQVQVAERQQEVRLPLVRAQLLVQDQRAPCAQTCAASLLAAAAPLFPAKELAAPSAVVVQEEGAEAGLCASVLWVGVRAPGFSLAWWSLLVLLLPWVGCQKKEKWKE